MFGLVQKQAGLLSYLNAFWFFGNGIPPDAVADFS
jgi:hypothetical protein